MKSAHKQDKIRLASLLMAAVLLLSTLGMAGCGTEKTDGTTAPDATSGTATPGESGTAGNETVTEKTAAAALERIGNPDWGDDSFTILYTNDIMGYTEEIFSEGYGSSAGNYGQGVTDAVYERNQLFENRCHLKLNLVGRSSGTVSTLVRAEVNSPAGEYQLVTETANTTASMATEGLLYDWLSWSDVDYATPWWDSGTLEFALNGRVYFMNGANNFVDDDVTFTMIFNKKMQSEHHLPDLYQVARDGDWTLTYFDSVIQNVSHDSNGDGRMDENDTYGFSAPCSIGNTFFYGAGLRYVNNSRAMESPELALDDGAIVKATTLLDIVRNITLENNSSWIAPSGKEAVASDIFKKERGLFYCEAASYLMALNREMTGDYGVLPIPKYDKAQQNYLTWTHGIGSTFSIPRTAGKTDILGSVVETYTVLSYQTVKPAYYDNMLTHKNVRDGESGEMLDLIFRNRVYDMAVYFSELGMAGLFSDAALSSTGQFASTYKKVSVQFPKKIRSILRSLERTEKKG